MGFIKLVAEPLLIVESSQQVHNRFVDQHTWAAIVVAVELEHHCYRDFHYQIP